MANGVLQYVGQLFNWDQRIFWCNIQFQFTPVILPLAQCFFLRKCWSSICGLGASNWLERRLVDHVLVSDMQTRVLVHDKLLPINGRGPSSSPWSKGSDAKAVSASVHHSFWMGNQFLPCGEPHLAVKLRLFTSAFHCCLLYGRLFPSSRKSISKNYHNHSLHPQRLHTAPSPIPRYNQKVQGALAKHSMHFHRRIRKLLKYILHHFATFAHSLL
jgi:hypothetical protein